MTNQNAQVRPWNPLYIGVLAYFCLLAPGVVLMSLNFKRMGFPAKARNSILWGIPAWLVLLALYTFLPQRFDALVGVIHIAAAFTIAAIPYADYRRLMDQDRELRPASLLKPAFFSILFPLGLIAGWYGYARYLEEHRMALLKQSLEAYNRNDYPQALRLLNETKADFPEERLVYINKAIVFEAMQNPDSAIHCVNQWLSIAPGDAEAKEMLARFSYSAGN